MDMDRYIGRLLDNRYEILEVIGIGGMAVVYKARCHRLNRLVAIKILKDDYSQDEEFRNRFHAESQAVAMLGHPNIVSVYDVSTTGAADYIVMELIDGISLKQYMEKKGVLNWKETLHFSIQIAKALEHAHSRGIVHRDIKPHNIMLLKNGSVKVAEFGIARLMSKGNTLTKEALGSVHYISPEQAKGGRVDNRSDLYSLGVVMYEMMAGRPPYDGESPVAVAIQHINGGAPMPSTLNPNIPGGLEQIIMKSMALDPNDRYDSATAMLFDIEEFRKDPTILFDYYRDAVEEVPNLHVVPPVVTPEQPIPPRTTAEKVAGTRSTSSQRRDTGSGSRREGSVSQQKTPAPAQRDRQKAAGAGAAAGAAAAAGASARRSAREEQEEERSRIATIAIVACSAVAVVAIIIFLITLLNGGWLNKQTYVDLPNLVGAYYDDVKDLERFELVLQERAYDEDFEKDQIINQKPEYTGQQVVEGTKIYVTVSSGPEPQEKVMEDLVDLDEAQARSFLDNQKMDLQVLVKRESSDTVDPGRVTRTDPAEGAPLEKGQTVYLWISEGAEKKMAKMPYVVDQDLDTALKVLEQNGFNNVDYNEVESEKEAGTVISQSVTKNKEVDVTTEIILEVSKGPKTAKVPKVEGMDLATAISVLKSYGVDNVEYDEVESEEERDTVVSQSVAPNREANVSVRIYLEYSSGPKETTAETTVPPETEDPMVTMVHTINLPTDKTEDYVLSLRQNGVKVVDDLLVTAGTASVKVELTGSGKQTYELFIDDVKHSDVVLDFTPYG